VATPFTERRSIPPSHDKVGSVKITFQRWVTTWFVMLASVSIALAAGWYISLRKSTQDVVWVAHTHEVLLELQKLGAVMDAALIGIRGYSITGDNAGTVTITAGMRDDGLGRVVFLGVRDTGVGIKTEDLGRLFQQFTQLDGNSSRKVGGTGLGLAISAHYVRMHGGRIDVASEYGNGTEFTVVLPILATPPPAVSTAIEASVSPPTALPIEPAEALSSRCRENPFRSQRACNGLSILCIDDEPDVLKFLQLTFEDGGYDVLLASEHDSAIAEAKLRRPDLICLDLNMPGKDGFEVLKTLRGDPGLCDIPVVVVSVSSEEARCLPCGALRYLAKPDLAIDLIVTVRELLEGSIGGVLIVEDNPDSVTLYADLLAEKRVEVRTAANGRGPGPPGRVRAVGDRARPHDADHGRILVPRARPGQPIWGHIRVIILTAMSLSPDEVARLKKSSAGILVKGRDATENVVESILAAARATRRVAVEVTT
jgi:CheY-like chemotaxis protein